MPKVDHGKPLEETALLKVTPQMAALPVLAPHVPNLLVPGNRERDGRAGTFDVEMTVDVPSDYRKFAAKYALGRAA